MALAGYVQPNLIGGAADAVQDFASESTFLPNLKLPVHRWFRYSAGFSAQWAERVIAELWSSNGAVLDPFVGSGTTVIAAEQVGAESYGLEAHPFVARVAAAKLCYRSAPNEFERHALQVLDESKRLVGRMDNYPSLIRRIFDDSSLSTLDTLRQSQAMLADGSAASSLTWLALVSILRQVSHAGTAPWQYVLPSKTKSKPIDPASAFVFMVRTIASDMRALADVNGPPARILVADARTCAGVGDNSVSLVVTSPPYPNNYDYADATRIEMSFLQEIGGWGDLQDSVRRHLIRSCSQHVSDSTVDLAACLAMPVLRPIRDELTTVCEELARVRQLHGGRKSYHLMVCTYFLDIAESWIALRRVCQSPSRVCFVIGDSAPYGVYVPVVEWMSTLAQAAGFDVSGFEKTRDRNVKWKNRKHRVPLVEGRLWANG